VVVIEVAMLVEVVVTMIRQPTQFVGNVVVVANMIEDEVVLLVVVEVETFRFSYFSSYPQ
jgi:hypothetical protein